MKRCMKCGKYNIEKEYHDYCNECFAKKEQEDNNLNAEDHFRNSLSSNVSHTVYVMFYGNNDKIGYTNDLNSRLIEIKRKYPDNKLVYFREFITETSARRFESWLKKLSERELSKLISGFQDKIKKVENIC